MKNIAKFSFTLICAFSLFFVSCSKSELDIKPEIKQAPDFTLTEATATINEYEQLIMAVKARGSAGSTYPSPHGQLDGAPVLGYVFPTTLKSSDIGFGDTKGIVAMALTSHPDFDDTPLWDENNDQDYSNDGRIWHAHWVVLVKDERVAGGLSVKEFEAGDQSVRLPPTNPGMPMYLDSPGFNVIQKDGYLKVIIPLNRIHHRRSFHFDAVCALMRVNTSDKSKPMLGVYEVYSVLSGNLSMPFSVN